MNDNVVENNSDFCLNYRSKYPTAYYLYQNPPPEWFPLIGIGAFFVLCNNAVIILEISKHSKYYRGAYFKLASRVTMLLSAFWIFAQTSFLGIIFTRGDSFLHFVANSFESACILAFFDMIVLHSRAIGETFDGTTELIARVPPCCCCLPCLPKINSTKTNIRRLRICIYQMIFFQTMVEFARVLLVFDCAFLPEAPRVVVTDALVVASFLLAMWALFVLVKSNNNKLSQFKYMQKFAGFKAVIIVSKFAYKLLVFIANRDAIPSYKSLGAKQRVSIWTNFITVVVSTLLLLLCRRLYSIEDYDILGEEKPKLYSVEEDGIENLSSTIEEV